MLGELITVNIFSFFLIFSRIGTSFIMLPGFSSSSVSVPARLSVALGVSLVMTPVLSSGLPGLPATVPGLFLLLLGEAIVGAFIGTMGRILISALQIAGTVMALTSSMANVLIQDPIAEQQSALLASFLSSMGLLLIFVTNTHYLMLQALVDSYSLFVPGQPLPIGDFADFIGHQVADSFAIGVKLASPLVVTSLAYNIALGLLGRLMPSLPLFLFGLPLQIMAQIWVLILVFSSVAMVFISYFEEGFIAYLTP